MTIRISHYGNDQMGAPTAHKGMLENCPAPECQDRAVEQQELAGTVDCPHGQRIVERDPEASDKAGVPVGRIVVPWPCAEPGCTLPRFEASCQDEEDAYWESLLSEVYR